MDDQQNLLDYETIKGAVAGEKWATARILMKEAEWGVKEKINGV